MAAAHLAIVEYPEPGKISMMKTCDFRFNSVPIVEMGVLGKEIFVAENGFKYKVFTSVAGNHYRVYNADWSAKRI